MAGLDEQALAVGVGGDDRAVAGQRQAERLGQAVHGIGGEHAGAGAAGRAGGALHRLHFCVGIAGIGGRDHRVDEVDLFDLALDLDLAGLHRAAGDEDDGDVEAQRRHQHAGRDLVAVGDADQRVGAMGVDHVFDAVGDQLARGQGIEHAVVAHRDAVVDGDGVEFLGDAAGGLDLARDELAEILQMHVTGHELGEGIGDGDDRLAEIALLDPGGAPEAAGAGHVAAVGGGSRAIGGHGVLPGWVLKAGVSQIRRPAARPQKRGPGKAPFRTWRDAPSRILVALLAGFDVLLVRAAAGRRLRPSRGSSNPCSCGFACQLRHVVHACRRGSACRR